MNFYINFNGKINKLGLFYKIILENIKNILALLFLIIINDGYTQENYDIKVFAFQDAEIEFFHKFGSDTIKLSYTNEVSNVYHEETLCFFYGFSEVIFPEKSFLIVSNENQIDSTFAYLTRDNIVLFSLMGLSNQLFLFSFDIDNKKISELDFTSNSALFLIDESVNKLYSIQSFRETGDLFISDMVCFDLKTNKKHILQNFVVNGTKTSNIDILQYLGALRYFANEND